MTAQKSDQGEDASGVPPRSDHLYPPVGLSMPTVTWHFHQAMYAYKDADVARALHHFNQCRSLNPGDWFVLYMMAQVELQLVGDVHEAIRLLKYARRLREREATPKEGKLPYIYLHSMWGFQIGHIANMEHLIKREILRGNDTKRIIHLSPEKPANPALLAKMAAYTTVVKSEEELPHPEAVMRSVLEEYYICESIDGIRKHWWHASPEIFDAWERAGHAPLLSLTGEERARGSSVLRQLGMPDGAWFVTLHVRGGGFKEGQGRKLQESGLNADGASYLKAIEAIIERGGWVVRIGDASMDPMPAMKGLIDYAHSPLKSDWMDVYLLGACRFFVGTSSGPAYVPPLFGIPCALTNWYPTGSRPFNRRDIYIPKLFNVGRPTRRLRFEDMFRPPIGYALRFVHAAEMNLSPVDNTDEEIREVVTEMLDKLDNKLHYSREDRELQRTFETVAETNFCYGNARMGADFLRRHRQLLL